MKLRVYLDTSVFSAYFDERMPERQAQTREFWERLAEFEVATCSGAREEMEAVEDVGRRDAVLGLLSVAAILPITDEMRQLAGRYVAAGTLPAAATGDALHVAVAALTRQDILVSWNWNHLVNRRTRAAVNHANVLWGLPALEIAAPPQV